MLTADSLFVTFQSKIHDYIWRRISDPDITNDLASQTFYKATEAIASGKGPRTSVSGWLYRIAHNLVIDYYRQRERHKTACLDDFMSLVGDVDPAHRIESIEMQAQVKRAMQLLTEGQQQVIRMRYIEGYKFGEIADAMGITEGAVKALQHRGIMTLRSLLAARHDT